MGTAFVTGATGLLGCHLIEQLLERGDSVRALVRPSSDNSILDNFEIERVHSDLSDIEILKIGMRGVDMVYHCAARPPLGGSREQFHHANVIGTENLIKASMDSKISRLVHISTIDVYGYIHHDGADETTPLRADGLYSESKVEAEKLLMRYGRESGFPYTILRPCLLYGHYDQNMFPAVLAHISQKIVPLVDGGKRYANLIYAGDVAGLMIEAAHNPNALFQVYNVTDGVRRTAREIVEIFADAVGLKPRIVNAPYPIAYPIAVAVDKAAEIFKLRIANQFNRAGVKAMGHNRNFDISKVVRDLGFKPKMTPEQGLRWASDWYQAYSAGNRILTAQLEDFAN